VTDSATQEIVRSRRAVLAAAAGGAAALAASAIGPASVAAAVGNMQTETDNPTTAPTGVTNSTGGSQALFGHATGAGNGVEGTSVIGHGVRGVSTDASDPENNTANAGVVGVAGSLANIAANVGLTGVYGYAEPSGVNGFVGAGVWGDCADFGVIGSSDGVGVLGDGFEIGVVGFGEPGAVGVIAAAADTTARALRVEGRAEFTRSGRTSIASGKSSKAVTLAGCTSSTLVFAVLASNRSGRYVRAVVPAAGKFTIYLNSTVSSSTNVAWIAFTNPSNHSG
jgi:hypothetical protein